MPIDYKAASDLLFAREQDLASDFYLKSSELAKRWRTSEGRLRDLRHKKQGPAYVKLAHGCVRYRASVVLNYEAAGLVEATPVYISESDYGR